MNHYNYSMDIKGNIMDITEAHIRELISNIGKGEYKDGSSRKEGKLYHPIPFEEFNNIPVHKKFITGEFSLIMNDIGEENLKGKKILEIGCANGYYTFSLSPLVDQITAYEGDKNVCDVNNAIKSYKSIKNISFVNKYFDDTIIKNDNVVYDIAFMTNVHMWIYKQIGEKRTLDMMRELSKKTKTLYFETAHAESGGGFIIKELKTTDDIIAYLHECGFNEINHLLTTKKHGGSREIFKCQRT